MLAEYHRYLQMSLYKRGNKDKQSLVRCHDKQAVFSLIFYLHLHCGYFGLNSTPWGFHFSLLFKQCHFHVKWSAGGQLN